MTDQQHTVARDVFINGTGIHTGEAVSVRVMPAPANTGIVFVRADLPNRPTIPARSTQVLDVSKSIRRTTVSKDGAEVQTVEHLMAACWGVGIDNAYVEVSGCEIPGLDGSSQPFVQAFLAAGLTEQPAPQRLITLREPIVVEEGEASISLFPSRGLKVSYMLSYDHPMLKSQFAAYASDNGSFAERIAPARTFCLKEEADALRAQGFGKGATLENTLVLDREGLVQNTLRFEDEFVRHKILDLLGDL
jgi:UDP-3-O-acyl N-acetylglucosamine deacetylase